MLNSIFKLKKLLKIFIFFPVIFYFGKRSYIAFDEGFYDLQARWILEKGNWIVPLWWDNYAIDRTIGLQCRKKFLEKICSQHIYQQH